MPCLGDVLLVPYFSWTPLQQTGTGEKSFSFHRSVKWRRTINCLFPARWCNSKHFSNDLFILFFEWKISPKNILQENLDAKISRSKCSGATKQKFTGDLRDNNRCNIDAIAQEEVHRMFENLKRHWGDNPIKIQRHQNKNLLWNYRCTVTFRTRTLLKISCIPRCNGYRNVQLTNFDQTTDAFGASKVFPLKNVHERYTARENTKFVLCLTQLHASVAHSRTTNRKSSTKQPPTLIGGKKYKPKRDAFVTSLLCWFSVIVTRWQSLNW